MKKERNSAPSEKQTNLSDRINLDYDFNTEYGDGDIPDVDKNSLKEENEDSAK